MAIYTKEELDRLAPPKDRAGLLLGIAGLVLSLIATAVPAWFAFQGSVASADAKLVFAQSFFTVALSLLVVALMLAACMALLSYLLFSYSNKNHANKKLAIAVAQLQAQSETWRKSSKQICEHFLRIVQGHFDYCAQLGRRDVKHTEDSIVHALTEYLDAVLLRTSQLLREYMGDEHQIACCIKVFTADREQQPLPSGADLRAPPPHWVFTLRRDQLSRPARRGIDEPPHARNYEYRRNTAFRMIVDRDDKPDYFFCNDLANYPDYESANPNWPTHYNATMVVPIKDTHARAKSQCAALLCADGMHAKFDDGECLYMLEEIATLLYHGLQVATLLLDNLKVGGPNGQNPAAAH